MANGKWQMANGKWQMANDAGEGQARCQGRRQWRKVHLAMGTATSDIRAVAFTSSGGSPVLPEVRDRIPDGDNSAP